MQHLKRFVAFALTFVLCAEALLGNGVASAVALALDDLDSWQETVQPFVEANGERNDSHSGDVSSAVPVAVDAADSVDMGGSSSAGSERSQDADSPDQLVLSLQFVNDDAGTNRSVASASRDFTSNGQALKLSSDGLTIDDRLAEFASARTFESLPVSIPATLSLKASLSASVQSGDYFSLDLPEGFEFDLDSPCWKEIDGSKALPVYRAKADGSIGNVLLGYASPSDTKLTVTFRAPVDESLDASAKFEPEENLVFAVDVLVDSKLFKEAESQIDWVIQGTHDGEARRCVLQIPALSTVEMALGLNAGASDVNKSEDLQDSNDANLSGVTESPSAAADPISKTITASADVWWQAYDSEGDRVFDAYDNRVFVQKAGDYIFSSKPVEIELFQDGQKAFSFTLTGSPDNAWQSACLNNSDLKFTWRETSPWHLDISGLPRFDDDGHAYDYLFIHSAPDGFILHNVKRDSAESPDDLHTSFYFDKQDSEDSATYVPVSLSWLDGHESSRAAVKVYLRAARDFYHSDGMLAYFKDDVIQTVTLSADCNWYSNCFVPCPNLDPKNDFYLEVVSSTDYDVVDYSSALSAESKFHTLTACWEDRDDRLVSTDPSNCSAYRVRYDFNSAKHSLEVICQRMGYADLSVNTAWLDEGADISKRPAVAVNISALNSAGNIQFVYDASGQLSVRIVGVPSVSDYPLYIKENDGSLRPLQIGLGVSCSSTELTISSAPFSLSGLPLYDCSGKKIDWAVVYSPTVNRGDYVVDGGAPRTVSTGAWHHQDQLDSLFTFKRQGKKSVTVHTKWFDHYVNDQLGARPALNLSLYRLVYGYNADGSLSGESHLEKVAGVAPTWHTSAAGDRVANDSSNGDYTRYATFDGLDKYDAHGKMIAYYVLPTLESTTGSHGNISYTYNASAQQDSYTQDPGSWDKTDGELASEGLTLAVDGDTAYRESSTLCYRVEGFTSVTGIKHWKNIPSGFTGKDLPSISIYLQRRMASGSYNDSGVWTSDSLTPWSSLQLTLDAAQPHGYSVLSSAMGVSASTLGVRSIADGQTAVAWTTVPSQEGFDWSYSLDTLGDNAAASGRTLPAFDDEGRLFEYRAREVIDGMIGLDGLNAGLITSPAGKDSLEAAFGNVFDVSYDGSSVTNAYKSTKGSLAVREVFAGCESGAKLPKTAGTFKLYRYYTNAAGKASDLELVDEQSLASSDMSEALGTLSFTNLDIYAPVGSKWKYVVFESAPNAYSATSGLGQLSASSDALNYKTSSEWAQANGVGLPSDLDAAWTMGPSVVLNEGDDSVKITFKNTYVPESTELSGAVKWVDNGNAFNTRPDGLSLTLMRTYVDGSYASTDGPYGMTELQDIDPSGSNYISWDKGSDNTWTYKISNVDKLATDGDAWKFKIEEASHQMPSQYSVSKNYTGGAADASTGAFPDIQNELMGQVGFSLTWKNDSNDAWKQRPTAYFALEAREAGSGGGWKDAVSFFIEHGADASKFAATSNYDNTGLTAYKLPDSGELTVVKLKGDSGQTRPYRSTSTWSYLPLTVKTAAGSDADVEYRVVESRLLYNIYADSPDQVMVSLACDDDGQYSTVPQGAGSPYMPVVSQSTQASAPYGTNRWMSDISNVYDAAAASLKVTKTWDDANNALVTRPGTSSAGDAWSARFALQRSADGGSSWEWFTRFGTSVDKPFNDDSSLNGNLFTFELSSVNPRVFLENLPATVAGATGSSAGYLYRAAEVVKGSYRATTASSDVLAVDSSGSQRLEVVPVGEGGEQAFVNQLVTVKVSGKVFWNDWGSGLADNIDPTSSGIAFKLYRRAEDGTEELVQTADAAGALHDIVPAWSKNSDGSWVYSFEGCVATDQEGRAYTYRLEEVGAALEGWHKSAMDANGTITYTATRLTFDALEAASGTGTDASDQLYGASFEILNAAGAVVARWSRDSGGQAAVSVEPGFGKAGAGESSGWVVGLPAGEYTVHETNAPAGHLSLADFAVTINADGGVSLGKGVDGVSLAADGFSVLASHTVYRSAFTLSDTYRRGDSELPVYGMTFDVYRGAYDSSAGNGGGVKIASITSGDDGTWQPSESVAWENRDKAFGDLARYYAVQADGLPAGDYYIIQTGELAHIKRADSSSAVKSFELSDSDFGKSASVAFNNAEFNASLALEVKDASTGKPINEAVFALRYTPLGSSDATTIASLISGKSYSLDSLGLGVDVSEPSVDGELKVTGLKKGSYELVETAAATGYAPVDADRVLHAFAVADAADGSANVLTDAVVTNDPLLGSVSMTKVDASGNAIARAQFNLERKSGESWIIVSSNVLATDSSGRINVTDLPWGTYRFSEVSAAQGYYLDGGHAATSEVTISADNVAASAANPFDCGTVVNRELGLTVRVANVESDGLAGARLLVTGRFVDGTSSKELETDNNGNASLSSAQLIQGESYTVTQTSAPEGYKIGNGSKSSSAFTFTVNADGTFNAKGDYVDAVWFMGSSVGTLNLTIVDTANTVSISMVDADSKGFVSGATFEIHGRFSDSSAIQKTVSPINGALLVDGLIADESYTVIQTSAPKGYKLLTNHLHFILDACGGELTLVDDIGKTLDTPPDGWQVADSFAISALGNKTQLSFDRVDAADGTTGMSSSTKLDGVALEVSNDSGVVARWSRDGQGSVTVSVEPGFGEAGTGSKLGTIQGLPSGEYTVHETVAPKGHLAMSDFKVNIDAKGAVSLVGSPVGISLANDGFTVISEGQLYRSDFKLSMTYARGSSVLPVAGMTFDLYCGTYTSGGSASARLRGDSAEAVKIATITTLADGSWLPSATAEWENRGAAFGALARYFVHQSDGLPAGDYYLVETGESPLTVKPSASSAVTPFSLDPDLPGLTVPVAVSAWEFNASLSFTMRDSVTQTPLNDVDFELRYTPLGSSVVQVISGLKTGHSYYLDEDGNAVDSHGRAADGVIEVKGLKKGSYRLVQMGALPGYPSVPADGKVVSEFGVDNDQSDASNVLADQEGSSDPVVPEQPLLGSVKALLADAQGNPLPGGVFKLQRKDGSVWSDCATDTFTSDSRGRVETANLEWGTYRFVEVTSPSGFYMSDGAAVTDAVTVDAQNVAGSIDDPLDCGTLVNSATVLSIAKVDVKTGTKLDGARFEVKGVFAGAREESAQEMGAGDLIGELVSGNVYSIRETVAPQGYQLRSGALKVRMGIDGKLEVVEAAEGFEVAGSKVTVSGVAVEGKNAAGPASRQAGIPGTGDSSYLLSLVLVPLGLMALALGLKGTRKR